MSDFKDVAMLLPYAFFAYVMGCWILEPLRLAKSTTRTRFQFRITDCYILMIQLAIAGFLNRNVFEWELSTLIFFWIYISVSWCLGICIISRVPSVVGIQRTLTVAITVPLAYLGSLFASCYPLYPMILLSFIGVKGVHSSYKPFYLIFTDAGICFFLIALIFIGGRLLASWAVRSR